MSSSSTAVNSDATMVQGRPLSREAKEKAVLGGMRAMHIDINGDSPRSTGGIGERAAKQSNKHSNAGNDEKPVLHFCFN